MGELRKNLLDPLRTSELLVSSRVGDYSMLSVGRQPTSDATFLPWSRATHLVAASPSFIVSRTTLLSGRNVDRRPHHAIVNVLSVEADAPLREPRCRIRSLTVHPSTPSV